MLQKHLVPSALALALATLAGCAPWAPHPVSMSSMAMLCVLRRVVWCEQGEPLCATVQVAVAAINAVVPDLLVYAGELPRTDIVRLGTDKHADVTVVLRGIGVPQAKAAYEHLPIAFTMLAPSPRTACLETVPVVLVWPVGALSADDWTQVITHEMLHSLGATHAPEDCPFSTVMHPGLATEHRIGLGEADKSWLRAVYGQ